MRERRGLERAGERALQLALGLRRFERRPVDADPGAAARRPGAHVGRDLRRPGRARGGSARPARHARRERMQLRSGTWPVPAKAGAHASSSGPRPSPALLAVARSREVPQPRPPLRPVASSSSSNQWARAAMMISLPCSSVRPYSARMPPLSSGRLLSRWRRCSGRFFWTSSSVARSARSSSVLMFGLAERHQHRLGEIGHFGQRVLDAQRAALLAGGLLLALERLGGAVLQLGGELLVEALDRGELLEPRHRRPPRARRSPRRRAAGRASRRRRAPSGTARSARRTRAGASRWRRPRS